MIVGKRAPAAGRRRVVSKSEGGAMAELRSYLSPFEGRRIAGLVASVALTSGVMVLLAGSAAATGPESVAEVAEPLLDAVVNISTSQTVTGSRGIPVPRLPDGSPFQEFFDEFFEQQPEDEDRPRRVQSLGSGFVIDSSGILVTNNHVIEGADEITANFNDGSKLTAEVVGRDEKTDIAVIRVTPEKPLPALRFGSSEELRVGDWVMAIGNPFGLGGTVTVGIVSARNRDINSGPYDNFIQTDASINRGNSGGPLFNMEGEVVGINTAIISPTGGSIGIGFAVPAETAIHVIDQLREFGETRRGWLGVRIQSVTDDIAESLSMQKAEGALVAGVTKDGPAEAAGILPGDVIVEFDGRAVASMPELPRMVADEAIGKEVKVVVLRKGERQEISVTLGRLEDAEKEISALDDQDTSEPPLSVVSGPLGLTLADLTPTLREKYEIAGDVKGVIVTDVAEDSPSYEKRVQAGDVIVEISQEPVATPDDVKARIEALKKDGRKSALFLLANKDGDLRFVAVNIEG
jgi:serine protease Do